MTALKTYTIGPQGSGKTELIKQLLNPSYVGSDKTPIFPTIGLDFCNLRKDEDVIQLWDSTGNPQFEGITKAHMPGTDVGICCVNLSKELASQELTYIKAQLDALKKYNPAIKLILVGTHNDKVLPGALSKISRQLKQYKFEKEFSISTRVTGSSEELRDLLIKKAVEKRPPKEPKVKSEAPKSAIPDVNQKLNKILTARNRCQKDSDLYNALDNLNSKVQALKLEAKVTDVLGDEAHVLLNTIFSPHSYNLEIALTNFVTNCNQQLPSKSPLKGIIMSIAITTALTVMAGVIGFGIGFALGAWSGPGAFFSAIALGKASAMGVLAATVSTLAVTAPVSYSLYRFHKEPIQKTVDEFVEEVSQANLTL